MKLFRTIAFSILTIGLANSAMAETSPLSGIFVLQSTDCVGYLNNEQGNAAPRGFNVGSTIVVSALDEVFLLSPVGQRTAVDNVYYEIGTFDRSGPVSGGVSTLTSKYLNNKSIFVHGHDNLNPGDNYSSIVIKKTSYGLAINFDDVATCLLKRI